MENKNILLFIFILVKFFLQYLLINHDYDLQRDEYLHLDQANHLAWGFQSVPPVTSWVSYVIKILGNSFFWIKFFPALFGALTIVVVWKTIEELNGNLFALILGATCLLFSALLRLNFLFQPNSLDALCWVTFYFILIKYINSENPKWLYIGSIAIAFGFLNKYNIIFLLIGLLPSILLTEQRRIFAQKHFYFSILLGLLLVSPNLLWQYNNNFPVFSHLEELAETQLVHIRRMDFIKEQLFYFIGSMPVIIASLNALLFYEPFRKFRLFIWAIIFTLIVFMYFNAKSYYAIGLYPIYISFGAVFLGKKLTADLNRYFRPVLLAIPVIIYILFFDIAFSVKPPEHYIERADLYKQIGLLRWEDGRDHSLPQDFADMLGWKELAFKVDSVYSTLHNRNSTIVICDNYGQAGAINYYSKRNISAVSFNADYINWFDLSKKYENLIRVKNREEVGNELIETSPFFQNSVIVGSVTNKHAREYGTTIFAFIGAKIDILERLKEEIDEKKNINKQ